MLCVVIVSKYLLLFNLSDIVIVYVVVIVEQHYFSDVVLHMVIVSEYLIPF